MTTYIRDLENNSYYAGNYLVDAVQLKISKTGKEYMSGQLKDKTGGIRFIQWEPDDLTEDLPNMSVVYAEFVIRVYNGEEEAIVHRMYPVSLKNIDNLDGLLEFPPERIDSMMREINDTVEDMSDLDYKAVIKEILQRDVLESFASIPGGKFYHHALPGGLLMHTLGVLRVSKAIVSSYPAETVNRDLLYCGAILHDIGKVQEFKINNIGLVERYTNEGSLEGHIYLGAKMVGDACDRLAIPAEKSMLLQHLILSHHGSTEFGSPVCPQTIEAFILHEADLIDASVYKYQTEYKTCVHGTVTRSQLLNQNVLFM